MEHLNRSSFKNILLDLFYFSTDLALILESYNEIYVKLFMQGFSIYSRQFNIVL